MKPCFVFESVLKAEDFAKKLTKNLKIPVICPKGIGIIYVHDSYYKKVLNHGLSLLKEERITGVSWADLESFAASSDMVPIIRAEVVSNGLADDGHWKLPVRKQIKEFQGDLATLFNRAVFMEKNECGDVTFYITRTVTIEKEHKILRDVYFEHYLEKPFKSEDVFAKIVLCDMYGKQAKVVKNLY